ncbi:MAG: O-antigen ligase family protein [Patescibacteria group bacterium]
MIWFLFLYLISFPFGQLASFQLFPQARIHLIDVFAAILVLAYLSDILWKRLPVKKQTKTNQVSFSGPLFSFLAIAAFTLTLGSVYENPKTILVGGMYLGRLALYVLLYKAIAHTLNLEKKKEELRETLYNSLIILGFFISLIGLVGYFLYPDTKALSEYGWDNHYYRLIGPFLDPAFTGILIVLSLVAIWFKGWKTTGWQAVAFVLFLINWIALALTYSRASFVGAAAFFLTAFVVQRKLILISAVTALFILTYYLLPHPNKSTGTDLGRTQTISSRFDNYKNAINIAKDNPLFGVGYNLFKPSLQNDEKLVHAGSGIHSSLLFVLTTTGVVGLLVYLVFWAKVIQYSWWAKEGKFAKVLLCSVAALLAHSLFDNSLFYPWVMGWLAILLAIQ